MADLNLEPVTVLHVTPFFPIPKVYQRCQLASLMLYFLSSDISLTTCLLVIGRYRKIFGYMTRSATRVLGTSLYKGLCWLSAALKPITPIFVLLHRAAMCLLTFKGVPSEHLIIATVIPEFSSLRNTDYVALWVVVGLGWGWALVI